ncbi:MAG: zf-HC2 domain-containing protein [Sphingomonadales bacterium]
MTVADEKLMAYADGELGAAERAVVEAAIAADPALADRVAAHRSLRGALSASFDPVLDEPLPPGLAALKGSSSVVDLAAERERRRPSVVMRWGSLAATLVVGVVAGYLAAGPSGLVGISDGTPVARGQLARALDTQLAAEDPTALASPVRIGLTFPDRIGAWCRSFDAAQDGTVSGIACREGDRWQLRLVIPTKAQPDAEYRMAGSDEQIVKAAKAMMAGQPLDSAGEREVRDNGWMRSQAAGIGK